MDSVMCVWLVCVRNSMFLIMCDRCVYFFRLDLSMLWYFLIVCGCVSVIFVWFIRLVSGVWKLCVRFVENCDSWVKLFCRCVSMVLSDVSRFVNLCGVFCSVRCVLSWFGIMVVVWLLMCVNLCSVFCMSSRFSNVIVVMLLSMVNMMWCWYWVSNVVWLLLFCVISMMIFVVFCFSYVFVVMVCDVMLVIDV